ncbi:MAG: type II toxin-antitoxin system PemK/MazF family toxin [Bryobacteraceae bacterium]|jgi:mRNA interferase MazF
MVCKLLYLVEFDPARGNEIRKTGPALVIQNDIGNQYSQVAIVAAITSKLSPVPYPVEVIVAASKGNGLSVPSAIQLSQIRSVDRDRLVKRLGTLDAAAMRKIDQALKISLELVDL